MSHHIKRTARQRGRYASPAQQVTSPIAVSRIFTFEWQPTRKEMVQSQVRGDGFVSQENPSS